MRVFGVNGNQVERYLPVVRAGGFPYINMGAQLRFAPDAESLIQRANNTCRHPHIVEAGIAINPLHPRKGRKPNYWISLPAGNDHRGLIRWRFESGFDGDSRIEWDKTLYDSVVVLGSDRSSRRWVADVMWALPPNEKLRAWRTGTGLKTDEMEAELFYNGEMVSVTYAKSGTWFRRK